MKNKFLNQIRESTIQARAKKSSEKIHSAINKLVNLIKNTALTGKDSIAVDISVLNLNKAEAELLMHQPELIGFKCNLIHESIATDSPIGYYMADVLKISWE